MISKFGYGEYVGKAHVSLGLPCQDKALCVYKNGVYVAAVSDGCGSAKNSQMGSAKTVEIVAEQFTARFDEFWTMDENVLRKTLLTEICNGLRAMINENEELFGKNVKGLELCAAMDSLDATALFVAVKGEKVIAGMVGDGIVGAIDDGALRILMEEPKFEGLENATWYPWSVFYLSEAKKDFEINKHFLLRKYYGERFGGFILMSDGVSALIGRKGENKFLTGGTEKVFKVVAEGDNGEETAKVLREDLLRVLVNYSQSADDCSLAVLVDPDYYILGPVYKREETLSENPLGRGEPQKKTEDKDDGKNEGGEKAEKGSGQSDDGASKKDGTGAEEKTEKKDEACKVTDNGDENSAETQAQAETKPDEAEEEEKPVTSQDGEASDVKEPEKIQAGDKEEDPAGGKAEAEAKPDDERSEDTPADTKTEESGGEKREKDGADERSADSEEKNACKGEGKDGAAAEDEAVTGESAEEAPVVFGVEDKSKETDTGTEKAQEEDPENLISKLKKKFKK